MKPSKYTHLFQKDGTYYIYNSLHGLFADISKDLYAILYNRDYGQLPNTLKDELISQGLLVNDSDVDSFYEENKVYFYSQAYDKNSVSLVIVPTTNCNFECPYCFEGKKQPFKMTPDIEDAIIDRLSKDEIVKNIHITWYGGEPLLAFDVMNSLCGKLKNLKGKTITGQDMVTNGYLVDDEVIAFINEAPLESVQITLDGRKERHDSLRCLRGSKKPTFDKIMCSIDRIKNECSKTKLSIRVNVDRGNMEDFMEIYKMLVEPSSNSGLYVYPGFIRENAPDGCSLCFNSIDAGCAYSFYKSLRGEGLKVGFLPKASRDKGCMMQRLNSFIIGPRGELYKCWNDVNHDERIIGNIKGDAIENRKLFYHYMNDTHAFADPKCHDCLLFPVCSGGCGWYRSCNLRENGKFNLCPTFKDTHILEEALVLSLDKEGIKYEPGIQMA